MNEHMKAFDLFWDLYNSNQDFKKNFLNNLSNGKVRFFDFNEWERIYKQNYSSLILGVDDFADMFLLGYNIGNCVGASIQLSYSYNDVSIVSGLLPILKGTLNAEREGGHCWLETSDFIIDTSLMLVIDKSLKEVFGYVEEQRLTSCQLRSSVRYQMRKEYVNDYSIRRNRMK